MNHRADFLAFVAIFARAYLDHLDALEKVKMAERRSMTPVEPRPLITVWMCLEDAEEAWNDDNTPSPRAFVLDYFKPWADRVEAIR